MITIIAFVIGVTSWPLIEYLLHRFLGHVIKVNTLFKKEHTRHHAETNYFAPLTYKLLAAIPMCAFTILFVRLITNSLQAGLSFTAGFVAMFSFYEWFHWTIHAKTPKTKIGLMLRKHHLAHHFHNPKMNHGVTTIFIDKIMGTFMPVEIVKIPKNVSFPWLIETDSKTIKDEFKNDFLIR